MLMRIGETLAITFDTGLLNNQLEGDDRAGSSGRKVISLQKNECYDFIRQQS